MIVLAKMVGDRFMELVDKYPVWVYQEGTRNDMVVVNYDFLVRVVHLI